MNNQSRNNQRNNSSAPAEAKECYFCQNNLNELDYKNANLLRRFTSSYGKIAPRKRSGCCAFHQRKLATAIKQSRIMALLPFVNK
ncbi:MAG: 30S ribosomal protein S18 [Candidatus Buchananbacteria bacterium]